MGVIVKTLRKKMFTKQDFLDGKCDKNGLPLKPKKEEKKDGNPTDGGKSTNNAD